MTTLFLVQKRMNGLKLDILKYSLTEKDFIISDTPLCIDSIKVDFLLWCKKYIPKYELEFIYFGNNPEQCLKNVKNRKDSREVESFIKFSTNGYRPEGNIIPVYNGKKE